MNHCDWQQADRADDEQYLANKESEVTELRNHMTESPLEPFEL
ncbi:hypothetical protein [Enterococcus termitis]|nr:hypothetical protein [Enterococcus termitis]OJG98035.1 hypothetical protein RV18_GL003731 [Enterococcus termitis]